jgi:hypothetical protein
MNLTTRAARRVVAATAMIAAAILVPTAALAASGRSAAPASTAAPKCATSALAAWMPAGPGSGYAGGAVYELEISNTSARACTLYGFPGVSALSSAGHQLGSPASWDHAHPSRLLTLGPGATAHAVLRIVDVANFGNPKQPCRMTARPSRFPSRSTRAPRPARYTCPSAPRKAARVSRISASDASPAAGTAAIGSRLRRLAASWFAAHPFQHPADVLSHVTPPPAEITGPCGNHGPLRKITGPCGKSPAPAEITGMPSRALICICHLPARFPPIRVSVSFAQIGEKALGLRGPAGVLQPFARATSWSRVVCGCHNGPGPQQVASQRRPAAARRTWEGRPPPAGPGPARPQHRGRRPAGWPAAGTGAHRLPRGPAHPAAPRHARPVHRRSRGEPQPSVRRSILALRAALATSPGPLQATCDAITRSLRRHAEYDTTLILARIPDIPGHALMP